MDRNRVIERFWYKHAEIWVEKIPVDADDPMIDVYGLRHLPCCIFIAVATGKELARSKASEPMSVATLESLLETAKKNLEAKT